MSRSPFERPLHDLNISEPKAEEIPDLIQLGVASAAAIGTGALYFGLGAKLQLVPPWVVIAVLVLLTVPPAGWLIVKRKFLPYRMGRTFALAHVIVLGAVLVYSTFRLIVLLPTYTTQGRGLLRDGALLWVLNVLVFTAWYWEIDGGGPIIRVRKRHEAADFLFPQQQGGNKTGWAPGFVDYLFMAFCFSTALSPADTAPITQRGKLLMMAQSSISLIIIALLVARSVNILS